MRELRLSPKSIYLTLSRKENTNAFTLRADRNLDTALKGLPEDHVARHSPIFPLHQEEVDYTNCYLFFFGPRFPGEEGIDKFEHSFLTLGSLNIGIRLNLGSSLNDLKQYKNGQYELWKVNKGCVEVIEFSEKWGKIKLSEQLKSVVKQPLRSVEDEFLALHRNFIAKSQVAFPKTYSSTLEFCKFFRNSLAKTTVHESRAHKYYVNVNAVLSRKTEQLFSGLPRLDTNLSHYYSHSLFGIGTAELALSKVVSYLCSQMNDCSIVKLIEELKFCGENIPRLEKLSHTHDYWKTDFLGIALDSLRKKKSGPHIEENSRANILTSLSGRDGFRMTHYTMSAPLELLSKSNTRSWTPLTITHEFCHFLLNNLLPYLLPKPNEDSSLSDAIKLLHEDGPKNLQDALKCLLYIGYIRLEERSNPTVVGENSDYPEHFINKSRLADSIKKNWLASNEILVHCIDFLYFYNYDEELYINCLWVSWDSIANIDSRIPEYISRSLCALHTRSQPTHAGRLDTIQRLRNLLENIVTSNPDIRYAKKALDEYLIEENDKLWSEELLARETFVIIARRFLYSREVYTKYFEESLSPKGKTIPNKSMIFGGSRVMHPTLFISKFCRDKKPMQTKSVWILQHLAFLESN